MMTAKENEKEKPPQLHELGNLGWTPEEVEEISSIITQRADLALREKVIASAKKELNERASCLMLIHANSIVGAREGTLAIQTTTRSTLDRDQLQLGLATRGVPITVISAAVAEATKTTISPSVVFRPAKE